MTVMLIIIRELVQYYKNLRLKNLHNVIVGHLNINSIRNKFEKLLYRKINSYINTYLNSGICGFREAFSAQYCLITMTEKIKNVLDKGGIGGALLTELSKAFDCIQHDI